MEPAGRPESQIPIISDGVNYKSSSLHQRSKNEDFISENTYFLLIDLGNTSAKLRLAGGAHLLGKTRRLPTAALLAPGGRGELKKMLANWRFGRAVMSSVVPDGARVVSDLLPEVLAVGARTDAGVDLRGYPGRRTLGADRIANMAGALARHGPGPLVVVDFGTAATFNALDAEGRFLGGAIAPGWGAMSGYLAAHTAQLPPVRLAGAGPAAIGRSTAGAIRAGTLLGYRGLVREILEGLRAELGGRARVVATGGDARFLAARGWGLFDTVDSDLTLHGLRIIAGRA